MNPVITPSAQDVATVPTRITGLARTPSGRNGSSTRKSHQEKASVNAIEQSSNTRIVDDTQGMRVPPEVSTNRKATAPAIISVAPTISSRCERPCDGKRFIDVLASHAAHSPSGTLSQNIHDQCHLSAMTPPSTAPTTPAAIQAVPI